MQRKTFIIIGGMGSGKYYYADKLKRRRNRPSMTFDKIDTIPFLKQEIEAEIRADRDVYIVESRIERIPKEVLEMADKIIKK